MKIYFDTEYFYHGKEIQLISIGMIKETGEEYYAISKDFDIDKPNKWIQKNVIKKLDMVRKNTSLIKNEILEFVGGSTEGLHRVNIEIWGYFCAYDWVLLLELLGGIKNIPSFFPLYCRELRQEMDRLKYPLKNIPRSLNKHHALFDAKRNKVLHETLLIYRN